MSEVQQKKNRLSKIRNIGIIAHIDAGKTTTTERILFYTGEIDKIAEVHEGGTITDYLPQEQERKITIQSAAVTCFWEGFFSNKVENGFKRQSDKFKFNIIDTPGHVDFTIEVERSLRVLDGTVIVLEGVDGVQTQTVTVNRQAVKYKIPRIVFINKMDRLGADFYRAADTVRDKLNTKIAIMQIPVGIESGFKGVIDLISMQYLEWSLKKDDNYKILDIPSDMLELAKEYRGYLLDMIASEDDQLLEKYLENGDLSIEEMEYLVRLGTLNNNFLPIFCGSSYKNIGVQVLLDSIIKYLPSPLDNKNVIATNSKNEVKKIEVLNEKTTCGYAFKILKDKYAGTLCFVRIYSGTLESGMTLYHPRLRKTIRVGRLVRMQANTRKEISVGEAGEIVALIGVDELITGDTIWLENSDYFLESMDIPAKVINSAITPKTKNDYEKLAAALQTLSREDPSFGFSVDQESGQTIISGMGELHLEIKVSMLKTEYNIEVTVGKPKVVYRETIVNDGDHTYLLKKQSGGRGQFAGLSIRVMPGERGSGFTFQSQVVGGVIPKEYISSVEDGIKQAAMNGPLTGSPVVDFIVQLYDGVTHDVDSSTLAFALAARGCFREMLNDILSVKILEPIMSTTVEVPSEFMGSVVGDLNSKRGRIIDIIDIIGDYKQINTEVPLNEMFGYINTLREKTQGKGNYMMKFSHYAFVPDHIATILSNELKSSQPH